MLLVRKGGQDHRHVQVVRRRVVNHVDVGIGDQRLVAAVRLRDPERVGLSPRGLLGAGRDRDDVNESQATHRVDVVHPDKARADQTHANACRHSVR